MSETTITTSAVDESAPDHSARNRLVITLLLISTFVVILNETIMGVAIPQLMTTAMVSMNAAVSH